MDELKNLAFQLLAVSGDVNGFFQTPIPGLIVMRSSAPTRPQCILYRPALCLIVQGAKEMAVGGARATYREGQSLVVTADVPTLGHITEASPQRPFVGIGLELDLGAMREIIRQLARSDDARGNQTFELFVGETGKEVEDCLIRLIRAAADPVALKVLHASIMRELQYWLLMGPNGHKIARQVGVSQSARRISDVVHHIRQTFEQPIRVDQLAKMAYMSSSSFYQHFKSMTSMSPIQFQKQLRLIEARRLMSIDGINVAGAASQVGYESLSQFSREYSRMFGLPPVRDALSFSGKIQRSSQQVGASNLLRRSM